MFTFLTQDEEMRPLNLDGYKRHIDIYIIEGYSSSSSKWGVVFLSSSRSDAGKIWNDLARDGGKGRWRLVRAMKNERAAPDRCQYHRLEILDYREGE